MKQPEKYGLIGYPIANSGSPALFKAAYGGKYDYELLEIKDFNEAWSSFINGPYKAVNVTAPFKKLAAARADIRGGEVEKTGSANILLKTGKGIMANNSDFLGVRSILPDGQGKTAAIIGTGGAGVAAAEASREKKYSVKTYHHDEISDGISADLIIYTLPSDVQGTDKLNCSMLLEANYRTPCLQNHEGYVHGLKWLLAQAVEGYPLMTGEPVDLEEMQKIFVSFGQK